MEAKGKKSAKSTTAVSKKFKGFTDDERAAMKERIQELKADEVDGESAVLAKIAKMPEPDRTIGKRLYAIIESRASMLTPRLWYGVPAYSKTARSTGTSNQRRSSRRGTRLWTAVTRRTSTEAPCGRPPSR